jgi:prepilin-type N-terminal cleavage/methylation domain-containing protein
MKQTRGFTLIEMAIVLVIVTILIGGLVMPLSAQIQARRIAETNRTLEEARDAILGYAMTHRAGSPLTANRHLPCPDTDLPPDGVQNRSNNSVCDAPVGRLPWVDLGVAPQDAWGNRLLYAVLDEFSERSTGFNQSSPGLPVNPFEISSVYNIGSPDVAANVVFVIASHGPNGWGAQSIAGTTLARPSGPDEAENLDGNKRFVSRSPTKADTVNGEFDDLLVWVSHPQLIHHICPTGSDCSAAP